MGFQILHRLFKKRQVGNPVEPNYNGLNPSAMLFFEGDDVHSMLIFGGGGGVEFQKHPN